MHFDNHLCLCAFQNIPFNTFACEEAVDINNFACDEAVKRRIAELENNQYDETHIFYCILQSLLPALNSNSATSD
jgi:hypothetical protein